MGIFRSFFFWLLLALVLCVFIASVWFWFMPIGINNYINKISINLALASPQTLTLFEYYSPAALDVSRPVCFSSMFRVVWLRVCA